MWKTFQLCRNIVLFEPKSWQLLLDVGIWGYLIVGLHGIVLKKILETKKTHYVNMIVAIINLNSKVIPDNYFLMSYSDIWKIPV